MGANFEIGFNHLKTFTAAEFARSGYALGMEKSNRFGSFVMSKAIANITKGMIVIPDISGVYAVDEVTYDHTKKTFYKAAAGAIVAENEFAGLIFHIDDDTGNVGYTGIIKGNTACGNYPLTGGAITIYLEEALPTDVSATVDLDITIFDPNKVELAVANTLIQPVCGVAPVTVAYATAPYFWRQVDGLAAVIDGTATPAAVNRKIGCGDGTAGQALENNTAAGDDACDIGIVVQAAPADGALALVRLFSLR